MIGLSKLKGPILNRGACHLIFGILGLRVRKTDPPSTNPSQKSEENFASFNSLFKNEQAGLGLYDIIIKNGKEFLKDENFNCIVLLHYSTVFPFPFLCFFLAFI